MNQGARFDGLTFVALGLIGFMGFSLLRDTGVFNVNAEGIFPLSLAEPGQVESTESPDSVDGQISANNLEQAEPIDSDAITAPYEDFIVTQGLHGFDYGHMAIDISAGKGAIIHSPINGIVTNLYIDDWGNPSLLIENDRYIVELLHGIFTVKIGDSLTLGQPIGQESNQGNTVDEFGRSCRGRNCGYHTHINVYDNNLGANVNPLELFGY